MSDCVLLYVLTALGVSHVGFSAISEFFFNVLHTKLGGTGIVNMLIVCYKEVLQLL